MNCAEEVFLEIEEVEKRFLERLEEGNMKDSTLVEYPDMQHNKCNGKFTDNEVILGLKELKKIYSCQN